MEPALQAFASSFHMFLLYGAVSLGLWAGAVAVYVWLTPYPEIKLIREGNAAAGVSLAAILIGTSIPLAMALATSVSLLDLVLWGASALVLQLLAFRLVDLLLRELPRRIEEGEMAAAAVLAGVKLGTAILTAAAMAT